MRSCYKQNSTLKQPTEASINYILLFTEIALYNGNFHSTPRFVPLIRNFLTVFSIFFSIKTGRIIGWLSLCLIEKPIFFIHNVIIFKPRSYFVT